MSIGNIVMLSYVDGDPKTPERMKNALQRHRPDVIAVHASPEFANYWVKQGIEETLAKYARLGLRDEAFAAIEETIRTGMNGHIVPVQQYGVDNDIPVTYVGEQDDIGQALLGEMHADVDRCNSVTIPKMQRHVDLTYGRMNAIFESPVSADREVELWYVDQNKRDLRLSEPVAERLEQLARQYSRVVHVGVPLHSMYDFSDQQRTVFSRLRDQYPKAISRRTITSPEDGL